jgi:hypothetical protein
MTKTGLAVGIDAGHKVTERTLKPRPAARKGVSRWHRTVEDQGRMHAHAATGGRLHHQRRAHT